MEKKLQNLARLGTKNFGVYLDEVSLKNGRISKRIFVDHPQAAAIVPFVSDNEIILVRQYRYAFQRETLEIPAGKMDQSENPEQCIQRELMEETGYKARCIKPLCTYAPTVGYSNELIHLFSGTNLVKLAEEIDGNEISSIEIMPLGQVCEMIRKGSIIDSKTIIGVAFVASLV